MLSRRNLAMSFFAVQVVELNLVDFTGLTSLLINSSSVVVCCDTRFGNFDSNAN